MTETWQWLAVAGLGAFHGLNPAMGWLYAVALGLQRSSFKVVLVSLLSITLGHFIAVAVAVTALLVFGQFFNFNVLRFVYAGVLLVWVLYLLIRGHKARVRYGMTVSLSGLAFWSFFMTNAHAAGLMMIPAVMPATPTSAHSISAASDFFAATLAAVLLHSAVMLLSALTMACLVYYWLGVGILRQGWINLDYLWIAALLLAAIYLLIV